MMGVRVARLLWLRSTRNSHITDSDVDYSIS